MRTTARKKILITCGSGSGPIYLARVLKKKYNVFLVDGSSEGVAPHLGFPFQKIPFGNNPSYILAIKKLVKKWNIDCIVPGADEELTAVLKFCQEAGVVCILPQDLHFIELCLNKSKLMNELAKHNISNLLPFKTPEEIDYPAVAKPNRGRGSREMHILRNATEMEGYLKLYGRKWEDLLVQPYIKGDEYTVSVIVNNLNALIGIVPKRVISKRGITRVAVSEVNKEINKVCEKIIGTFAPQGPFNVQLKLWQGKVYIFEINPRLSTTSVLTDKVFGNEVELYLAHQDKIQIRKIPKMKKGVFLYRYEENIFR